MSRLTKRNATLKASCKENSTYDCLLEDDCITCDCNNKILEKLAHYEDLEEAGRLITLPCRVGDKAWVCFRRYDGSIKFEEYTIIGIAIADDGNWFSIERPTGEHSKEYNTCSFDDIGKDVFLNKEKAEAKLAELKEGAER